MATQTIVKNTTYTLDLPIPNSPDEINLNTLKGVYINLTNEDGSVTFNKVIDFTQLREKYSDFGTNPYHTVIKGLHNNTLTCDIIYDNETTPKLVLTYEWKEIPSEDPAAREEQYHNIAITSGNDTTNLKIKIEPYVGATYDNCGIPGLVPYATPSEKNMFLKGDGIWDVPEGVKDINVTLDKEIVSETKEIKIYKRIFCGSIQISSNDNGGIYNEDFDFSYETYNNSEYALLYSNVSYKSNLYINDTSANDNFYISILIYPEDENILSNLITKVLGYDDPNYYILYSSKLFVVDTPTSLPIGTNTNSVYYPQNLSLSDLPQVIGETKTFNFNESILGCGGSGYSSYISDRHLDFSTFDVNIKKLDEHNFEVELYWKVTEDVEVSTEIAKINHNITKSDKSVSTDTLLISVDNTTETIYKESTTLDIVVKCSYYEYENFNS